MITLVNKDGFINQSLSNKAFYFALSMALKGLFFMK